ncbi:MAG: hypothetical protein VB934_19165 [Polyangiaceae bacterium]
MTLKQLIVAIDQLETDLDIYAAPVWSAASFALVVSDRDTEGLLADPPVRLTFLMSVATAKALIVAERAVREPTADELCDLLVYHAIYDTPPPRQSDIHAAPVSCAS